VVTCEESWEEIDKKGCVITKITRHAWISSNPINRKNIHERCNLAARKRWLHENNILKEKHQGYHYEHIFSHDWNAMRGYHYLMHIARMLNEMVLHSISLIDHVKEFGIQSCIEKFRIVMTHRELDTQRLRRLIKSHGHCDWCMKKTGKQARQRHNEPTQTNGNVMRRYPSARLKMPGILKRV